LKWYNIEHIHTLYHFKTTLKLQKYNFLLHTDYCRMIDVWYIKCIISKYAVDGTYSKTFKTKMYVIIILFICDILTITTVVAEGATWIRGEGKVNFFTKMYIKTRTTSNGRANNIYIFYFVTVLYGVSVSCCYTQSLNIVFENIQSIQKYLS